MLNLTFIIANAVRIGRDVHWRAQSAA